ncbi:ATP-binding protein [Streptomyces sp. t39]|uniref:ATP-binding protein n=1 Tax=Streptomyces sp. t39 TaxID=1828156 RepID=UPI00164F94FA|nr:ATP-binding protein [Streptomyces sp. t39]
MDNDSFGESAGHGRPPRDAIKQAVPSAPAPVRTVQLVTGDYLLTVNPVDGSEIELCPPLQTPARPVRHTAAERAEVARAGLPPVPAGPAAPRLPLLERDEPRERLVRLIGQGRSVRLTGPAGSGRTALLDAVAEECADVAPDGVVRLNGLNRTPGELLQELFATVFSAPGQRPDRNALAGFVRDIGAVVILDDLEFGGAALDELLDAAPECAFLLAATPEVAAPSADSPLEEVFLGGLGRATALELLRQVVGRALTEEEANWAGDLWFESEGLPLRFVQAGALLRQCDDLRGDPEAFEDFAPFDAAQGRDVPLPTLGEGAAPAPLLASRLSESARATLRFAVALGGEVPHQAHLPALVGDTHADAALGELMACGLLSPAGPRYRLAAGVLAQLREKGYDEGAAGHAHTAAQHYTWWAGHPSVTPERAVAEADALLASLAGLVPAGDAGYASTAVLLARSAAPAFAAGRHWGAWERALRSGSEAARIAGEVAEDAYFHHELGVLALCTGNLDRARAELEASIGMRGALADRNGTVAGRRTLALVEDRTQGLAPKPETLTTRPEGPQSPPRGVPLALASGAATARLPRTGGDDASPVTQALATGAPDRAPARRFGVLGGTRRNLVAVGAGAVLAVVLGTVVTLGATSGAEEPPAEGVRNGQQTDDGIDDWGTDEPAPAGEPSATPDGKGSTGPSPSASPGTATPSPGASATSTGPAPSTSSSRPATPSRTSRPPTAPTSGPAPSSPTNSPSPSASNPSLPPSPTTTPTGGTTSADGSPTTPLDPA